MSLIDRILTGKTQLIEDALKMASLRQKLIASNLANIETPGYRAQDLKFFDYLKAIDHDSAELKSTNPRHFRSSKSGNELKPREDLLGVEKPDGNNVDLDIEMSKLKFTKSYYQTASSLLKHKFQMIMSVIKGF